MSEYEIYIDGQKIGKISNDQTKEFQLAPGQHVLYSKIGRCTSQNISFEATNNDVKSFKVSGFKYGNWVAIAAIAICIFGFIFSPTSFTYSDYLLIPIVLILIYYLTIGRKKCLTITEIFN